MTGTSSLQGSGTGNDIRAADRTGRKDNLADEKAVLFTGRHEKPGMFQLLGGIYILLGVWAMKP